MDHVVDTESDRPTAAAAAGIGGFGLTRLTA